MILMVGANKYYEWSIKFELKLEIRCIQINFKMDKIRFERIEIC